MPGERGPIVSFVQGEKYAKSDLVLGRCQLTSAYPNYPYPPKNPGICEVRKT